MLYSSTFVRTLQALAGDATQPSVMLAAASALMPLRGDLGLGCKNWLRGVVRLGTPGIELPTSLSAGEVAAVNVSGRKPAIVHSEAPTELVQGIGSKQSDFTLTATYIGLDPLWLMRSYSERTEAAPEWARRRAVLQ